MELEVWEDQFSLVLSLGLVDDQLSDLGSFLPHFSDWKPVFSRGFLQSCAPEELSDAEMMNDKSKGKKTGLLLPGEYFLHIMQEVDATVCVVVLLGLRKTENKDNAK